MQQFVTESEKKVRELIDTTLKDLWQKMKIENPPEQFPYPEGRLVLGASLFKNAGWRTPTRRNRAATTWASVSPCWRTWAAGSEQVKQIMQLPVGQRRECGQHCGEEATWAASS